MFTKEEILKVVSIADGRLRFVKSGRLCGRYVTIKGSSYLTEKVMWFLVYDQWPEGSLRFHDGDWSNRDISNIFFYSPKPFKPSQVTVWDKFMVNKLIALQKEGLTDQQIAFKLGKSKAAIRQQINKRGIRYSKN